VFESETRSKRHVPSPSAYSPSLLRPKTTITVPEGHFPSEWEAIAKRGEFEAVSSRGVHGGFPVSSRRPPPCLFPVVVTSRVARVLDVACCWDAVSSHAVPAPTAPISPPSCATRQGPASFARLVATPAKSPSHTVASLSSSMRTAARDAGLEPSFSPMALTSTTVRTLMSKSQSLATVGVKRLARTAPGLGKTSSGL
jgi:hypothetical protein